MEVIYDLWNRQRLKHRSTAVALGLFDGLHLGHQRVIEAASNCKDRYDSAVLTFTTKNTRPGRKANSKDILSSQNRVGLMNKLGIDLVFLPDFEEIRGLSAEEFVSRILGNVIQAKVICCGEDYRFGQGAKGDVSLLKQLASKIGAEVWVIPPVLYDGVPVSSTRIRTCLLEGKVHEANQMLGYHYFIEAEVVRGKQLGSSVFHCPTLNQELDEEICMPKYGVYYSSVIMDKIEYPCITNIGIKPTIEGERKPLAETHIIGINRDLYHKVITVYLHEFIREEQRFGSFEALKNAIENDVQKAKCIFQMKSGSHIVG